jgi:hypothetical protein
MKLKRLMKEYYTAKLNDLAAPPVPALNFLNSKRPARKHGFRKDLALNVLAHAVVAVMLIAAILPGRRDSELPSLMGKRAEELSLNEHIHKGLVTLSKCLKSSLNSN